MLFVLLAYFVIGIGAANERYLQIGWSAGAAMRYCFPLLPAFFAVVAGGVAFRRRPVLVFALAGSFALAAVHPLSCLFVDKSTQSDQS